MANFAPSDFYTHFSESCCSKKESKRAHASLHTSSVLTSSLLPPSLSFSLSPLSLKMICFTGLACWCRAQPVLARAQCCTGLLRPPAGRGGQDAASSASQSADPLSQLWQNLKICDEEEEGRSFSFISLLHISSPPPLCKKPEPACRLSVTKASRATFSYQGHYLIWRHSQSSVSSL